MISPLRAVNKHLQSSQGILFALLKRQYRVSESLFCQKFLFHRQRSYSTTLIRMSDTIPTPSTETVYTPGSVAEKIFTKCSSSLGPLYYIDIINESSSHSVPKGSETHFKVLIVSDQFEGKMLVQRHRMLYTLLREEMRSDAIPEDRNNFHKIHALSIIAKTKNEWDREKEKLLELTSPKCLGGSKLESSSHK